MTSVGRLRRRAEFLRVAAEGRKFAAPGLVVQALRAGPDGSTRVGFTVSRKVGGAVARNRARRRLRALADELLPDHAAAGHDYVVIGRAATVTRRFAALRQDLETALRRLGAWREPTPPKQPLRLRRLDAEPNEIARKL
jgi:ribonuclease P protein component